MKHLLSIAILACLTAFAGGKSRTPPATGPWLLIKHTDSWKWSTVQGSSTVTIPAGSASGYPTFIVNTTLGPLTGKTLSATVTLEDPTGIWYPGLGSWNSGGLPANVRLYFSTSTSYSLSESSQNNYWWSSEFDVADFNMTLSSSTVTSQWSNGMGKKSDDPAYSTAFRNALANAKVVGIALCGGSFFDMGWIYYTSDGPANLSIISLTAQ